MTNRRPRVVYWNNIPTPYVEGRFAALAARGNLSFEAWFNDRSEADRSWEVDESRWGFDGRYIEPMRLGRQSLHLPFHDLHRVRPQVMISLFSSASFALGSMMAASMGGRIVWRILPTFDSWIKRTRTKEIAKHALFRAIDAAKVPGPDGAAVAERYGVPSERIFSSTQSVDVDVFGAAAAIPKEELEAERARLRLRGTVFLYVGRLLDIKGINTLLDAYRSIRRETETTLVLVGDGADEPRYRSETAGLPDVRFLGFKPHAELPLLYAVADAIVFPTLGDPHGLVVDEAMAAGKPVLTTDAAGDIRSRIENGVSGIIVPARDVERLAEAMRVVARDPQHATSLGTEAARRARRRSHDRWAEDVEALVEGVLHLPRRTSVAVPAFRAGGAIARVGSSLLTRRSMR